MTAATDQRLRDTAQAALRIAVGLTYFVHCAQKLLGWFGGFDDAGTAELMTRFGAAGVIETVAGALIVLGLFTRPAALIASGEMAVAYFWIHWGGGDLMWWQNRGELVMIYAFVWLLFAAWGAGPYSLDAWWQRRYQALSMGSPDGHHG